MLASSLPRMPAKWPVHLDRHLLGLGPQKLPHETAVVRVGGSNLQGLVLRILRIWLGWHRRCWALAAGHCSRWNLRDRFRTRPASCDAGGWLGVPGSFQLRSVPLRTTGKEQHQHRNLNPQPASIVRRIMRKVANFTDVLLKPSGGGAWWSELAGWCGEWLSS